MTKSRTKTKTIHSKWAHVVKNPKGYIDPYKVVVGNGYTFHSWHTTRASAAAEAARINKTHGGFIEVTRR